MSQSISIEEARERLIMCNSYESMPAIFELSASLGESDWFTILGEKWSCCDNIGKYSDALLERSPLGSRMGPVREMMTDEEWEKLHQLPEEFEVFRGCYRGVNEKGLSFSTRSAIAEKFPQLNRYKINGGDAIVLHGRAKRSEVLALKLCRNEEEVILRSCRLLGEIPLK